jgi:hypothetical protein
MSVNAIRLAASANPDRPYQLTPERSFRLSDGDRKKNAKLVKKQEKWATKLKERLDVSDEDAAVILQITQHTMGCDEFPLHAKDKQQMMKLARQLSQEFGYSSSKSTMKPVTEYSDHTSVTEPETERSEDDLVQVAVKKKKMTSKQPKNTKKKTKPTKESLEMDAIDSLDDKVMKMEHTMDAMKHEITTLLELNKRMAFNLTEVLKRV